MDKNNEIDEGMEQIFPQDISEGIKEIRELEARVEKLKCGVYSDADGIRDGLCSTHDPLTDWVVMHFKLDYEAQLEKLHNIANTFASSVDQLIMVRETYVRNESPQIQIFYAQQSDQKTFVSPHQNIVTSHYDVVTRYGVLAPPGLLIVDYDDSLRCAENGILGCLTDEDEPKPRVLIHPLVNDTFAEVCRGYGDHQQVRIVKGLTHYVNDEVFSTALSITSEGYSIRFPQSNTFPKSRRRFPIVRDELGRIDVIVGDSCVRNVLIGDTQNTDAFHAKTLDDIVVLYRQ